MTFQGTKNYAASPELLGAVNLANAPLKKDKDVAAVERRLNR